MISQTIPNSTVVASKTETKLPFTILFATDGSVIAERAFEEAVALAYHAKGRLILTFYADTQDSAVYGGQPCCNDQQWRDYGSKVINKLAERARAAGVSQVETVLEQHQDEESLYQLGDEVGANMTTLASYCFRLN